MSDFIKQLERELQTHASNLAQRGHKWAEKVAEEARRRLKSSSVKQAEGHLAETLGVKTGRLSDAVEVRSTAAGVEVVINEKKAPHAKYVIKGTRYIKPHPILESAAAKVGDPFEDDLS